MRAPVLIALALVLAATGCAPASRKIVAFPTQGQTFDQIDFDKLQCEQFAHDNKNNDDALVAAGMGALVGSAYGAAYGALAGAVSSGARSGSLIGAGIGLGVGIVAGIVAGSVSDHRRYLRIYAMCMSLRGYSVTD